MLLIVLAIIFFALFYSFLNGANDAANEIAAITATKALSPFKALILSTTFNTLGAFVSIKVAETIGKGIVLPQYLNLTILLTGVIAACLWTFFCTRLGIPISVTHALVGGLMGSGMAFGGWQVINWTILKNKVFIAILLGPALGFLAGALFLFLITWLLFLFFKKMSTTKTEIFFRKSQIITAPFLSLTHGMNDTQNAMGIIAATLLASGYLAAFTIPVWVKLSCGAAMSLGVFIFGWRVIKTLGWKLTKIEPKHGFNAQIGAGSVVGFVSLLGMPVSTTHVVASAIMGGTVLENWRRVKPKIAQTMVISWIITIPCAALLSAGLYHLIRFFS